MLVRQLALGVLAALAFAATSWGAEPALDQMAKLIVDATERADNKSFIQDNFAKDVASKLLHPAEADDAETVDFDIFTYAQDPDYPQIKKTIKSEVKDVGGGSAIIRTTFTQYEGDKGVVEYHLKKSGEHWLVEDIVYPNDDLSLRSVLGLK